jgi:hypothetical protein
MDLYISENILAVSYIGQRESVGVGIINPSLLMRPNEHGRRRVLIRENSSVVVVGGDAVESGVESRYGSLPAYLLVGCVAAAAAAAAAALAVMTVIKRRQKRVVAAAESE